MSDIRFDTDLLALLPPWYREVLDYQAICQTEEEQFEALAEAVQAVADNLFFQSMDQGSVALWEQVLGIVPDPQTESLDFRRSRVINRLSTRPPFTLRFLEQKLDELIGPGAWTVTVDYPNYTLYIESSAENQQYAAEVAYTIGRVKPAHIVYVNTPYVRTGLLLSESIALSQRTFHYKLGAWGLGVSPFATEQDQGVIKMPDVPSIQDALLQDTASFVSSDIASARVNGTISITDLEKTVQDGTITVTYAVDQSQADVITSVELLNSGGQVLTSSTVYVPVSASTIPKHVISVKEGTLNG